MPILKFTVACLPNWRHGCLWYSSRLVSPSVTSSLLSVALTSSGRRTTTSWTWYVAVTSPFSSASSHPSIVITSSLRLWRHRWARQQSVQVLLRHRRRSRTVGRSCDRTIRKPAHRRGYWVVVEARQYTRRRRGTADYCFRLFNYPFKTQYYVQTVKGQKYDSFCYVRLITYSF